MSFEISSLGQGCLNLFNRIIEIVFGVNLLFLMLEMLLGAATLFLNIMEHTCKPYPT